MTHSAPPSGPPTPDALRPRLVPASDASLLVSFAAAGDREAGHLAVRRLLKALDAAPLAGVLDLSPALLSILVRFDPLRIDHDRVAAHLEPLCDRLAAVTLAAPRLVTIPVAYGGADGPDLEELARRTGLPPGEVVARHSGRTYEVQFLGFTPGFAYLGTLDPSLHCPRLDRPRLSVPAGSVAVAGDQTAVYPSATPGGWRLIGRTPLRLFDPDRRPMSLLEMGDTVRFEPLPAGRPDAAPA